MESNSTTTQIPEDRAVPSIEEVPITVAVTRPPKLVEIGDIVLVRVDEHLRRPMIVTAVLITAPMPSGSYKPGDSFVIGQKSVRLSGTLFCEPTDYAGPIFGGKFDRSTDPARFHGRPSKTCPVAYGELLAEGSGMGQWITRPTNSPSGS